MLTIAYCIINAIATPVETVMLPILALDIFGEKCFNKTLGIITSVTTVGQALGTPLLNLSYDYSGNYNISFIYSTVISFFIVIIMNRSISKAKEESENV